jgi:hypothetical protein
MAAFVLENDSVSYVRSPDVVDHHGEQIVDPSLVEESVGPFQRGDLSAPPTPNSASEDCPRVGGTPERQAVA